MPIFTYLCLELYPFDEGFSLYHDIMRFHVCYNTKSQSHNLLIHNEFLIKQDVLDLNGELIIWIYVQVTPIILSHTLTVTDITCLRGANLILYLETFTIISYLFAKWFKHNSFSYKVRSHNTINQITLFTLVGDCSVFIIIMHLKLSS